MPLQKHKSAAGGEEEGEREKRPANRRGVEGVGLCAKEEKWERSQRRRRDDADDVSSSSSSFFRPLMFPSVPLFPRPFGPNDSLENRRMSCSCIVLLYD